MSNSRPPPIYTPHVTEIPLDLTVKRPEMDNQPNDIAAYEYQRSLVRCSSLPLQSGYPSYHQPYIPGSSYLSPDQYPPNPYQTSPTSSQTSPHMYHNMTPPPLTSSSHSYQSSTPPPHTTHNYQPGTPSPPHTPPHMIPRHTSHGYSATPVGPSSPDSPTSLHNCCEQSDAQGRLVAGDSCILPKKRKNLWRPYDSKAVLYGDMDKDSDSGSDSGSGSASDQEFKAPTPPLDPVKKRKMNMLQYASKEASDIDHNREQIISTTSGAVSTTSSQVEAKTRDHRNGQWEMTSHSDSEYTPMTDEFTKSNLSALTNYPDTRDKMISGMKKRDIFGWSLKLMKPSPDDVTNNANDEVSSQSSDDHNVCQDGEKTYIELQTVKKCNSPDNTKPSTTDVAKPGRSSPKQNKPREKEAAKIQGKRNVNNKTVKSKPEVNCNDKENVDDNVSKRVFIQGRDNVTESFNETENVTRKTETKKSLSLIDLIEEIEADALKNDKNEIEKTKNRNKGIAALLQQCNHVKLQALDFLMSNVIIKDNETQFTQKNENVQKMLKGDKIGSVSMLDVVELQVEMGLN